VAAQLNYVEHSKQSRTMVGHSPSIFQSILGIIYDRRVTNMFRFRCPSDISGVTALLVAEEMDLIDRRLLYTKSNNGTAIPTLMPS